MMTLSHMEFNSENFKSQNEIMGTQNSLIELFLSIRSLACGSLKVSFKIVNRLSFDVK